MKYSSYTLINGQHAGYYAAIHIDFSPLYVGQQMLHSSLQCPPYALFL